MFSASPSRKRAIAERWLALTLQTYPAQSRQFLQGEKDPFRNPVGQALRTHLPALVDELLGDMDSKNVAQALEDLMRMRAVQNFTAREALSFVFALKTVVREELPANAEARIELEGRIDEMALSAFDLFLRCRERIYEIQADEAKRRVAMLEKMHRAAER
jgi:hypothetical protein